MLDLLYSKILNWYLCWKQRILNENLVPTECYVFNTSHQKKKNHIRIFLQPVLPFTKELKGQAEVRAHSPTDDKHPTSCNQEAIRLELIQCNYRKIETNRSREIKEIKN